ncbi:MAG: DNA-processing protein DprA [Elusimicrobiota bacterium]
MIRLEAASPLFPELLRDIPGPPDLLYVRGTLPSRAASVAVVGSRKPTPYGRRMARLLASGLARAGVAVVSGLARGIDTEAHRAALGAGGVTWAVLGSGLDNVYPPENKALADEIAAGGGALVSEFRPDGPPLAANFPRRNRIIAGLSAAVVVVEGDLRSGALITARLAAEAGREVFAVPGPADSALSLGPNELLRNGAAMARSVEDILEGLPALPGPRPPEGIPEGSAPRVSTDEGTILELLGGHTMDFDELIESTGWELPRLVRALSGLEGTGLLTALPGQNYART